MGLFRFDLVKAILGRGANETIAASTPTRAVYVLMALAAIYSIGMLIRVVNQRNPT